MQPLDAASMVPALASAPVQETATAAPADEFGQWIGAAIDSTSQAQTDSETQARALAEGRGDLVSTMLSLNRAELSLSLMLQVRNRALDAYQEIMRLQV